MAKHKLPVSCKQMFQVADKARKAEQLELELFNFAQLLEKNYEFKLFLEDARISAAYKKKQLQQIFPVDLSSYFVAIVYMAIDLGYEDLLPGFSADFTSLLSKERGTLFGEAFSALAITEDQKHTLVAALAKIKNQPVILRYSQNKNLLGGLVVKFTTGEVWNLSLKHKLNKLKAAIIK